VANLCAKFEVSTFNRTRDKQIEGPKILKEGHVTLLRPFLTQFCIFCLGPSVGVCQIWSF